MTAPDDSRHLEAVHLRHVDIDQDDIRHEQIGLLDGHLTVRCLADDEDVRLGLETPAHAAPEEWMIVDDQDLDTIH
jgi:hypothetical protein